MNEITKSKKIPSYLLFANSLRHTHRKKKTEKTDSVRSQKVLQKEFIKKQLRVLFIYVKGEIKLGTVQKKNLRWESSNKGKRTENSWTNQKKFTKVNISKCLLFVLKINCFNWITESESLWQSTKMSLPCICYCFHWHFTYAPFQSNLFTFLWREQENQPGWYDTIEVKVRL